MPIEPSYWIPEHHPVIALTHASHLESQPDAAFELARAPDGLPLVLHARRAIDIRQLVFSAMPVGEQRSRVLERALTELQNVVRTESVHRRIVRIGPRIYYQTARSIASHFGLTLLARALGAVSPVVLPEDVVMARERSRFENSAVLCTADLAQAAGRDAATPASIAATPEVTFGRDVRMWIGVSRDTPNLAVANTGPTPDARRDAGRTLVFESLGAVRSARWHLRARGADHTTDGKLADHRAYLHALGSTGTLAWSISRTDAVCLVAELARAVDRDWHSRRRVHGDLKPGNALLDDAGIRAFDALDIPEGDMSPGMTEGWAAPEQILARPVTPATDVFALALMATAALCAVPFGEEQTVIVPAAGDGRRRLRMMKDPDVWLDPKRAELPTEARLAWRTLLVQCLASDPARRPPRGNELADRMDQLRSRWDIPGRLPIACGPGRLERLLDSRDLVWVLDDRS